MTQPTRDLGPHALKGWHYLTRQLGKTLPYQLTHGAHSLRAVLTLTSRRGR